MTAGRFLCVAAAAYAAYWFGLRGGCGTSGAIACPDPALEEGVGITLDAAEVCKRSGYLCAGRDKFQIARWALDKGKLRVRVRLPDFLEEDMARQVRDAAIEGIMEWDGHPFPLVIETGSLSYGRDIGVVWSQGLQNSEGGLARLQGKVDGKRFQFSVDGLAVVVPPIKLAESAVMEPGSNPSEFFDRVKRMVEGQEMGPALLARIKATAMHEMGHALGLMHSDSKDDIMFPEYRYEETQVRASERDLVTVDALYTLPNGAMVQSRS